MAEQKPKRRSGPKPRPMEDVKGANVTIRMRPGDRDRLAAGAEKNGRSISEEVAAIIRAHYAEPDPMVGAYGVHGARLLHTIGSAIKLAEISSGASFTETADGYDAAVKAVEHVLMMIRDPGVNAGESERSAMRALTMSHTASNIGLAAAMTSVRWSRGERSDPIDEAILDAKGAFSRVAIMEAGRKLMAEEDAKTPGGREEDDEVQSNK